ncbi:hypothetical protein J7L67_00575, partial [bacterium]|nr:hypothetical protein [bacterium]
YITLIKIKLSLKKILFLMRESGKENIFRGSDWFSVRRIIRLYRKMRHRRSVPNNVQSLHQRNIGRFAGFYIYSNIKLEVGISL